MTSDLLPRSSDLHGITTKLSELDVNDRAMCDDYWLIILSEYRKA